jgi:hypothetical protein
VNEKNEVKEVKDGEETSPFHDTASVDRGFSRDICEVEFVGFRVCLRTMILGRNVSHLRCSELRLPPFPALAGWATFWRASGAPVLSLEPRYCGFVPWICVCGL